MEKSSIPIFCERVKELGHSKVIAIRRDHWNMHPPQSRDNVGEGTYTVPNEHHCSLSDPSPNPRAIFANPPVDLTSTQHGIPIVDGILLHFWYRSGYCSSCSGLRGRSGHLADCWSLRDALYLLLGGGCNPFEKNRQNGFIFPQTGVTMATYEDNHHLDGPSSSIYHQSSSIFSKPGNSL